MTKAAEFVQDMGVRGQRRGCSKSCDATQGFGPKTLRFTGDVSAGTPFTEPMALTDPSQKLCASPICSDVVPGGLHRHSNMSLGIIHASAL